MLNLELLLSFFFLSLVVIAIPGPNILVIVATSLSAGTTRGLQTVAGTSLAMLIQLAVAALGTTGLLTVINNGLRWLKWAGVIYLLYLAFSAFRSLGKRSVTQEITALGSFQRGFWVSLTNPKTILFFTAFLPQFIVDEANYLYEFGLLSLIFWISAVFIDGSYAVLASRAKMLLSNKNVSHIQNGLSGTLYLVAGLALAHSNRS